MTPTYIPNFIDISIEEALRWNSTVNWETRTPARREFFMTPEAGVSYTYGTGSGIRTYTSSKMDAFIFNLMGKINDFLGQDGPMNGCFGNCYEHEKMALGWHSDDFVGMDHSKAVCVVSFGETRDLHFRPKGVKGTATLIIPVKHGSLLIMPPGMQDTDDHKVAKGSQPHENSIPRISATYRAFKI